MFNRDLSFVVLTAICHTMIEVYTDLHVQPGLYWLFSLWPVYWLFHQPTTIIKVSRLPAMSNKWFVHLLFVQFLFVYVPNSLLAACFPLAIGSIYTLYHWCRHSAVLTGRHAEGMRVGSRLDSSFNKTLVAYAPAPNVVAPTSEAIASSDAAPSAATPATATSKPHAPRPASHYEKLLLIRKPAAARPLRPRTRRRPHNPAPSLRARALAPALLSTSVLRPRMRYAANALNQQRERTRNCLSAQHKPIVVAGGNNRAIKPHQAIDRSRFF